MVNVAHCRQLLSDCGIGVTDTAAADVAPAVNQHRVLIFCQLKSMLDIVEYDLLQYVFCANCENVLGVCTWRCLAFIIWKRAEGVCKCIAIVNCLRT